MSRNIGSVVFYNRGKGFGFIAYGDQSIYVHWTGLKDAKRLYKHQSVRFTVGENEKGLIAEEVEIINAKGHNNRGKGT